MTKLSRFSQAAVLMAPLLTAGLALPAAAATLDVSAPIAANGTAHTSHPVLLRHSKAPIHTVASSTDATAVKPGAVPNAAVPATASVPAPVPTRVMPAIAKPMTTPTAVQTPAIPAPTVTAPVKSN